MTAGRSDGSSRYANRKPLVVGLEFGRSIAVVAQQFLGTLHTLAVAVDVAQGAHGFGHHGVAVVVTLGEVALGFAVQPAGVVDANVAGKPVKTHGRVGLVVAVHDGVRPLVSIQTIIRCFDEAGQYKAVVPVIELIESMRQVGGEGSKGLDRNAYRLVQTPQVFDAELLKKAYQQEFSELFTDDASVVEQYGGSIHIVEGNRENIKITTALDFHIAETLMENK